MKRIIKLSLLLLALLLPATAVAHNFEVDGIYYNINGNEVTVTYKGSYESEYDNEYSGNVIIPATVTYKGTTFSVTSIDEYAFCDCSGLTSVTIPNSVISISEYAFYGCSGLTSVDIPNTVTSICNFAFCYCSGLTSVNIPNTVTSIGRGAFSYCEGLTSIVIPYSVIEIGEDAFYNTAWYYNQPDGLVYAGRVAYKYKGTMPSGTSMTLRNGTTSITGSAFSYCEGLTSILIPNSVTSIGEEAFHGCTGLTSIVIPNSATAIGDGAFYGCTGLTSIVIPNSVTDIGNRAFVLCRGLTSIVVESGNPRYDSRNNCNAIIETSSNTLAIGCKNTIIPNSVTSIGEYAFYGCSGLTSINIPNSVTALGDRSFRESGLTSVVIPGSVKTIGNKAFMTCENLTDVTLSEGLTLIDEEAFCRTGITEIHLPESLVRIGEQAFEETPLTSITIPKNVAYLGNEAEFENDLYGGVFDRCQQLLEVNVDPANDTYASYNGMLLTKDLETFLYYPGGRMGQCVIPNTVTTIGGDWGVFNHCPGLTSVIIPSKVDKYVADGEFYDCDALTLVRIFAVNPPSVGDYPFYYLSYSKITLEVPEESVEIYRAHEYWGQFMNIQPIMQASGDVDGDGEINISDVTSLIDLLLSGGEIPAGADVDGDGQVNISDVTALIDKLLSGN